MSSKEKLSFQRFLKAEALFKTNAGLLIAQPDVSRQQYYNIEYDDTDCEHCNRSSYKIDVENRRTSRYLNRDSTTNITTSILPQLWNEEQSLSCSATSSNDDESTDSYMTSDDDDDDDVDWKCCAHDISFLNDYDNDLKISDDAPTQTRKRFKSKSNTNYKPNTGLDAFLTDILEETRHKKRNEAILLSMQRQNKSHIIHTQNNLSKQIHKKQKHSKSSFSSSHHAKLCHRCCHIFLNPKTRLNQILQLYHVERRLKPQEIHEDDFKDNHIMPDIDAIQGRDISHAIFHPSITTKLFDFTHKGHDEYAYKYVRKHINLPNIYQILSTQYGTRYKHCIISDHSLITLSTINRLNRAILGSQFRKLFIMYQLLQLFGFIHDEYNIVHGNLSPSLICINPHNLLITVTGWFTNHYYGTFTDKPHTKTDDQYTNDDILGISNETQTSIKPEDTKYSGMQELLDRTNIPKTQRIKANDPDFVEIAELNTYKQRIISQSELLRSVIYRWIHREISNFEYIMELNHLCGRMKGDPFNHPVLPWVVDFTSSDGIHDIGWRDLSKSKFRLTKGDHQIDHTFLFSPQPHHVTEVLSSLTYFLYLARRTPQYILQKAVRSRFEPKEYPISMHKLYQCVPEECIPEFYCDSTIFESIIDALPHLQIPHWCHSPAHFIQWHRRQLESKQVSENLHLWIDLNFGYRLGQDTLNNDNKYIFGYNESIPSISRIEAAIDCKNIPLQFDPLLARHCGVIQLFNQPHPPQIGPHNKIYNPYLDNNYLSHQQSMQIQRRIVEFGNEFLKLYSCTISPESLGFVLSDKDNTLSINRQNNNIFNMMPNTDKMSTINLRQKPVSRHQRSPSLRTITNIRSKSLNIPSYEEKKADEIAENENSFSNEDIPEHEEQPRKHLLSTYSPSRHSINHNDKSDRTRSKSQQVMRRRSKKSTSSANEANSQHMSYFAYDASGNGYVGYLNEDSRKRVGVVSPAAHYPNYKDDIFSLGCIMASIFTGKPLFCYNTLKKHLLGMDVLSGSLCKLPPVVSSCIKAMVNRDPSFRPNIDEVLKWDSLFVYGMKEMYDLIQYIHEWLSKYKLVECMERNDASISAKYIDLLEYITSALKLFPEIHPELFALIVPYLIEDIPIWSDLNESLLHYFKMVWCISSKLSEELCCYLLKKPFLSLLSLCQKSHELMMELLRPNTANFIRNHFGEYNFSKYYMKTIRSSLKSSNIQIRKTAEIFLISMNKFMELKLIENSIIDPILNDLNNNISLNPQEIRSFMMITQSRGEIFITKHVIPKMLNIINDKIGNKMQKTSPNAPSLYVIFAILELLIYLLKPHRNRKFVFQTGLKFTDNTAIFKCLRLPLNGVYFNLIEFKKLILLVIRIAQFFGPKSEITQSLLKALEPMMIRLKERVRDVECDSFNVYTPNDCRELLFMIYTSFQSIFSEKQLDAELDQIELKSSKQIKRIVLHYMEQRRSINNSKKDKKQTVSLKDHSPPILEPSTWKINVHSSFYQQIIKDKQNKEQEQELLAPSNILKSDELKHSDDEGMERDRDRETDNDTDNDGGENQSESSVDEEEAQRDTMYDHSPKRDKDWRFQANIHHIIQGHQPSTRILTIESKKNANLVLTGGSEGNIRMWRVEYSKLRDLTQYTQHMGAIKNISFLKYTDQIASCCGEIHVWDAAKCETIRKFTPHSSLSASSKKETTLKHSRSHPKHLHSQSMNLDLHSHSLLDDSILPHHNKIFDRYTCMTPFNYCCLLAGNQKGRIEFLDINTRSCSYDWEILPHSKLNLSKMDHSKLDSNISVSSSSSSSIRRVTAISVRSNQREVAVGLSDGQIVILDLRNGFIVESFHEFNSEITKLYWCSDNILIALCRDEGLYVFNCNQISRLYLKSCSKFKKYRKEKLFVLDEQNQSKKSKKSKFVTIGNENDKEIDLSLDNKNKFQQISKKLIEIGDASNDNNNDTKKDRETNGTTAEGYVGEDWQQVNHPRKDDSVLFNHEEYFDSAILNKDHKLRKKDVVIRTLLLNPNFNGDIDDYSRYTEHIRAYHSYINNNNSMASNGMQQVNNSSNPGPIVIDKDVVINPEIDNCNNLLPFTPIISKPFLFNSTPDIIAKYNPSKFDAQSLKRIKTNLSQYKITDFGLYKSNIICSIGKGIGYAKLKTPIQVLKEPTVFTQSQSYSQSDAYAHSEFAQIYNSKMITRSFPSLKTKSSLSSLSILENMHLVIIGTNNGKVFTCG